MNDEEKKVLADHYRKISKMIGIETIMQRNIWNEIKKGCTDHIECIYYGNPINGCKRTSSWCAPSHCLIIHTLDELPR